MENNYKVHKIKAKDILEVVDEFNSRMTDFNNKYGNCYSYSVSITNDNKKGYIADIKIKRNEKDKYTVKSLN